MCGCVLDAIQTNNYNANIHNIAVNSTSNSTSVTINYQTGENQWAYAFIGGNVWRFLVGVDIVNRSIKVPLGDDDNQGGLSLSAAGLKLLQYHELWVGGDVYTDPNGHRTIGYGHFVKPGEHFGHLSRAQGLALLAKDAQTSVNDVNRLVTGVTLTQTEFDAIVDFEFNIGDHNFANSTLLQDLNAGNFDLIKTDFMQWTDHGAGYAVRRREDDIQLFDNGIYVYR